MYRRQRGCSVSNQTTTSPQVVAPVQVPSQSTSSEFNLATLFQESIIESYNQASPQGTNPLITSTVRQLRFNYSDGTIFTLPQETGITDYTISNVDDVVSFASVAGYVQLFPSLTSEEGLSYTLNNPLISFQHISKTISSVTWIVNLTIQD